jgi:hypothetical protein
VVALKPIFPASAFGTPWRKQERCGGIETRSVPHTGGIRSTRSRNAVVALKPDCAALFFLIQSPEAGTPWRH